jgi:hypothetical protein
MDTKVNKKILVGSGPEKSQTSLCMRVISLQLPHIHTHPINYYTIVNNRYRINQVNNWYKLLYDQIIHQVICHCMRTICFCLSIWYGGFWMHRRWSIEARHPGRTCTVVNDRLLSSYTESVTVDLGRLEPNLILTRVGSASPKS